MAGFPKLVQKLPAFEGPFDAFKLEAKDCDILFASYPGDTHIPPHRHETENIGVITAGELILTINGVERRYGVGDWYHIPARTLHAARFEVDTSEIEFWFTSEIECWLDQL